ncbi:phage baseplate assembly protein V [uncultured Deefgea sp.]|uniref:phage baseplate assembly protein V n=1 Tax=uncultured Deefgea sp. TaxID=1304914 RepID=UPI00260E896C|nr:phage baseplate assembly protein V [uncultured Deefgea sp.]
MWREIDQRIKQGLGRVRQAFRGRIVGVKNAGAVMLVQGEGLSGEKLLDAELFQQFGFTSMPPEGTMLVSLPIGGKTSHSIVVATEHGTYRLKFLENGEAAMYSQEGAYVAIRKGRVVEVDCVRYVVNASEEVVFNTPKVHATAQILADGEITDLAATGGKSMSNMRSVYNGHDHKENDAKGNTNKPNQLV